MKRWHAESHKFEQQRRLNRRYISSRPDTHWVDELGRYRKKHAMDCGNTQCRVCHGDKFPCRELHEDEIARDLKYKEQLREYYEGD